MNKRIDYFDIAKGIAMLCIIAGHLGNDMANNFVFTFHVPIFFLISGYFLNDRLSVKEFAKQKAKQMMIPYVITWGFIAAGAVIFIAVWLHNIDDVLFTVLNQVLSGLYGSGSGIHDINVDGRIYISSIGAIWFLPALFFALVIVRYFMNRKYGGVWIFFIALLGYESGKAAWMPLSVQSGMVASSFVYLGMLAHKYEVMEKKLPREMKTGIAVLWIFCILFCGKLYLVENMFANGIVDYAGALAGSYIVVCFSRWLEQKTAYIAKILRFLGQNTLIMLCVHTIELKVMPWDMLLSRFVQHGMPAFVTYLSAKIIFCTIVTVFVVQIKKLVYKLRTESSNI